MSEELESSLKSPLGQIEEIKRCKQHDQQILSGRHRLKYLNMQGKPHRATFIDCDAIAARMNVSHQLVHWLIIRGSNIRRIVPEEEQKSDMLQIASILEADGIVPEKRVETISRLTGLSERRIQQLLPKEHKREYDKSETVSQLSEGTGKTEMAQSEGPVGGSSPPSPLHGEDASKHRISAYTEAEQLFAGNLSYYNIEYRTQETFVREEEFTDDGKQKTYTADFFFPRTLDRSPLIIELEGEGSASSNNEPRDAYFAKQGIKVAHLPNAVAKKYGAQIAELIAVLLK